jgi:hypothetical protein
VTPNPPPLRPGIYQPIWPNNPNTPVVTGGMPPNNLRMGTNNLGLGTNQFGLGSNQFSFRTNNNHFGTNSLTPLTPTGTNNNRILLHP